MLPICIASFLVCSAAEFSLVVPNTSVSAWLGSSVILPCSISPPLSAMTFEVHWSKMEASEKQVLLYKDQKMQENAGEAQYRDRAFLIGDLQKGDTSLNLKNLTVADKGEYVCFVESRRWYEKGSVNLIVKALGSPLLISFAHDGVSQLQMVNITCTSGGWSPKPTLTWRESTGKELTNGHTNYRMDSEGLVSVSSWLLLSPSDSEWISCTVGLNHQEMRESRIVIVALRDSSAGFWREAFIWTLVLSLIIIVTFTILLILCRKGLLPHCSSEKNAKAAADSPGSSPAETVPLKATENKVNPGISALYVPPEPTEERGAWKDRYKVSLTLDSSTADRCLHVSGRCKYVRCKKTSPDSKSKFPHVVSKEELGSGQYYWEVMVWDQKLTSKPKSSWCVGVTQKPHSEDVLRALCYEEGTGFYLNTDYSNKIPMSEFNVKKIGLYMNGENKTLSVSNADKTSQNHLHTFYNIPPGAYFAFFSPGVRDTRPVKILD